MKASRIEVKQVTVQGTMILWDGIPMILHLYNEHACRQEATAYRKKGNDHYADWLENRANQLKLMRMLAGEDYDGRGLISVAQTSHKEVQQQSTAYKFAKEAGTLPYAAPVGRRGDSDT